MDGGAERTGRYSQRVLKTVPAMTAFAEVQSVLGNNPLTNKHNQNQRQRQNRPGSRNHIRRATAGLEHLTSQNSPLKLRNTRRNLPLVINDRSNPIVGAAKIGRAHV